MNPTTETFRCDDCGQDKPIKNKGGDGLCNGDRHSGS